VVVGVVEELLLGCVELLGYFSGFVRLVSGFC